MAVQQCRLVARRLRATRYRGRKDAGSRSGSARSPFKMFTLTCVMNVNNSLTARLQPLWGGGGFTTFIARWKEVKAKITFLQSTKTAQKEESKGPYGCHNKLKLKRLC